MLLDGMHHPRRSTPDDRACPARRPRRNSLVSLHDSLRQAGPPARRGRARRQGVDRASARRTCSSLRASCQSSAIQGSRLDSFVASRFALSHDFPPAQAPNFRRFAAHSVKWAVGQFGTIPLRFGAFLSPLAPSLRIRWSDSLATILPPLATRHSPLATRHSPLATRHSPLPPTTLPPWLLPDTDRRIVKVRTGPDLDERALYLIMCRTRRFLRTVQSVPSHSPPLTRWPFSRGRRRSTPAARGVPA
jgi:hypothetical protein